MSEFDVGKFSVFIFGFWLIRLGVLYLYFVGIAVTSIRCFPVQITWGREFDWKDKAM